MITELTTPTAAPQKTLVSDKEKAAFTFHFIEDAKFGGFNDKDTQELLAKWGMQERTWVKKFAFDQAFQSYQVDKFVMDFFNDPQVNGRIKVKGSRDGWGNLGKVAEVKKEETNHSVTSLSFFDRLYDAGILRVNGNIIKCFDEYTPEGFIVSDELRKCLIMPETENYTTFSKEDRKEFIFHLFKALCLGGRLCQYEDEIDPYLSVTKKMYKDLISVTKDPQTNALRVASHVYKINGVESALSPLFPIEHVQNFCYMSVDPVRRTVSVWYHASDVYY